MPKISRKIVQGILQGGGKALTRLTESRVGKELQRTSEFNTSPSARLMNRISWKMNPYTSYKGEKVQSILSDAIQSIDNATTKQNQLIDVGILKATEKLLDKKLITPRQASNVFEVLENLNTLPEKTRYGSLSQKIKNVEPILENSPFLYTNRSKKLRQISDKITNNYLVGRELIRRLGTAGLLGAGIGAGVAGAKALASKSEPKNKSSDVKKMANRRNKYFS